MNQLDFTYFWKVAERIYSFLTSEFALTAFTYNILYCAKHKDYCMKWVSLRSLEDYFVNHCELRNIYSGEKAFVYQKQYWDDAEKIECEYDIPNVFLGGVSNISIFGGSNFIMLNGMLLLPNYDQYTSKTSKWTNRVLKYESKGKGILRYKKNCRKIDKGILLCGAGSDNYYHFIVEILPRLSIIESIGEYSDYPIIVDSDIKKISTLKEALDRVNISEHEVVWIDCDECISVKHLVYISSIAWIPINMKHGLWPRDYQFAMCNKALWAFRNSVKTNYKSNYEKIYISRRKVKNERLVNDADAEQICHKKGFKAIYPEELSFDKQVAIFHNAKLIVACAGAALTNCIFCNSGTKVLVIGAKEHESPLWSSLLTNMGLLVRFVDARIINKASFAAADRYIVDVYELEKAIDMFEG